MDKRFESPAAKACCDRIEELLRPNNGAWVFDRPPEIFLDCGRRIKLTVLENDSAECWRDIRAEGIGNLADNRNQLGCALTACDWKNVLKALEDDMKKLY